ncbi:MAG: hypothetical protein PXX77_03040 [Gallionella sp.]|nr:hypothetical protein [Gallionella sp.]
MLTWLLKSLGKNDVSQSFNGVRAIQTHLDQKDRIEAYVNGTSNQKSGVFMRCNSDWKLSLCPHGIGEKLSRDTALLDSICSSCDHFHDAVYQVVLLKDLGKNQIAKTILQTGKMYAEASEEFQKNLAELHSSNQR